MLNTTLRVMKEHMASKMQAHDGGAGSANKLQATQEQYAAKLQE